MKRLLSRLLRWWDRQQPRPQFTPMEAMLLNIAERQKRYYR